MLISIPDLARLVSGSCSCVGPNKMVSTWVEATRTWTWNPVSTLQTGYPLKPQRCLIWKYNLKFVNLEKISPKTAYVAPPDRIAGRHIKQWNTLVFMLSGTNVCLSGSCMTISSTYHLWRVHPPNFLGCVARDWLFSSEQVFQTKKFQEVTGKSKSMKYAVQSPWLNDMTFQQSKSHQRHDWVHRGPTCLRLTPSNAKLSMPGANISCHH